MYNVMGYTMIDVENTFFLYCGSRDLIETTDDAVYLLMLHNYKCKKTVVYLQLITAK